MSELKFLRNKKVVNAICLGSLCSVAYLAVYFARNILGAVTPQMIEGGYSAEFIGRVSSLYFIFYAVGQLINGSIGDRIKARHMICAGLFLAGTANIVFCFVVSRSPSAAQIAYGMVGFFLSMVYGPMTKLIAENTEPIYAARCSLGYTFASFLGSPLAGVAAAVLTWQSVLLSGSLILGVMTACCFIVMWRMEKKGIIKYNQYTRKNGQGGCVRLLLRYKIVKYTMISMITGVIRTTVIFWMPAYISQYLEFPLETASLIFTVATLIISMTAFITIFLYEKPLKRNMELTILIMFLSASLFFSILAFMKHPALNVACLVLGIMSSNGAATMLWSKYCPSLRDTGMVSGATGFLDFASYVAASVSSTLFANAINTIGWGRLILAWFLLMVAGVFISLPYDKIMSRRVPFQKRGFHRQITGHAGG